MLTLKNEQRKLEPHNTALTKTLTKAIKGRRKKNTIDKKFFSTKNTKGQSFKEPKEVGKNKNLFLNLFKKETTKKEHENKRTGASKVSANSGVVKTNGQLNTKKKDGNKGTKVEKKKTTTINYKETRQRKEKNKSYKIYGKVVTNTLYKTKQLDSISEFQQFWQNKTYSIFKDLINKKVHIGQHKKYLNSEMQPYIFGYLNNFCIINLNQTIIQLRNALKILYETVSNGGHITIIGTKTSYLDHVELFANNLGLPYVASTKWLGGSLTNFETIEKNFNKQAKKENIEITNVKTTISVNQNLENDMGPLTETLNIQNTDSINYKKLDLFKGLRDMGPSDLLIILNPLDNQNALNEARILGIPVISLVDTNTPSKQFKLVDYPIVANNESLLSISYFLQLFNFTIRSGLKKRKLLNYPKKADIKN